MDIRNQKGIALIFALMFAVNLGILEAAFVTRTIQGAKMAATERDRSKTFYAAHGGAQAALKMVDTLINNYLQNTILSASPSGVASNANAEVNSGDGIGWLVYAVRNNNVPVLSQDGDQALYIGSGTVGEVPYTYTIIFTEKAEPSAAGTDKWDFPYAFRVECSAVLGSLASEVALNGDFTVRVQKDNFAKFSLFTNTQSMPNGTRVWFTDRARFFGPVHTNDRFNFAYDPAGTFAARVSQSQQTARFYNGNSPVLLNADANGTTDVPHFDDTFARGVSAVTLNSSTSETDMVREAKNNNNYSNNGIYFPAQGQNLTGGIYVRGSSTISMAVDGSDRAVYTITQGGSTRVVTVDPAANRTYVLNTTSGQTATYNGLPHGASGAGTLIYVNGAISALSGTVQKDTELTIASHDDIVIANNVRYANYAPATGTPGQAGYVPPSAANTTNLLGIVSWNGDVRIGSTAPDDVDIHGTVMAENGIFQVDGYDNGDIRGTATLLGGSITDNYGAFGQFNSATGQTTSGYGRNFIYDERMGQGKAPPYFPSLQTFIAFTNDIMDKIVWQGMN